MIRFEFNGYGGKKLSVAEWNDCADPVGILQISHGMAEHVLRYSPLAEFMNKNNFIVFADDHRGHGRTDEKTLGYCKGDNFGDTVEDIALLTKFYREKYPSLPVIFYGHSYGSFLTQSYIQIYGGLISGAVIGGSCRMKNAAVPFGLMIADIGCIFKGGNKPAAFLKKMTFDAYNKKLGSGSFVSSILSESEKYDKDEFCGFPCSYNFYRYFFKGLLKIYRRKNLNAVNKELPLLLVSGSDDPVGFYGKGVIKLRDMYKRLNMKDVELNIFEKTRHEYLNDIDGEKAKKIILEFALKSVERFNNAKMR